MDIFCEAVSMNTGKALMAEVCDGGHCQYKLIV